MELDVKFDLNGQPRALKADPRRPLLEVLREELGLTGAKYGCGEGQCRACTVLIDGQATPSCITPIAAAQNKNIQTIEGLVTDGHLHPVQQAFIDAGAMQCGYCVPGMILTAVGLLKKNPQPSRDEIVTAMNGNICRCCGYVKIVQAVERAAAANKEAKL